MAAKASYLDHYLDKIHQIISCLDTLPSELQDNFNSMRDLDKTSLGEMKVVDKLEQDLFNNFHNYSEEDKNSKIEQILKMYKKANSCFDEKVQLAVQTYEMVDKHIRRLDADLARFEADLKEKALNPNASDSDSSPKKRGRKSSGKVDGKKGRRTASSDDDVPKYVKKKLKSPPIPLELPSLSTLNITHPSDVLDMPVDPNEPTYCFCHQVSYGEMIGCDNPDCPIEWFHFACVGLTSKPKGKWYCSRCSAERKKK